MQKWSIEEVMNDVEVAFPLTRAMCAPIGDGAAALILCSNDYAKKVGTSHSVEIAATVLASGETTVEGEEEPTVMEIEQVSTESNAWLYVSNIFCSDSE